MYPWECILCSRFPVRLPLCQMVWYPQFPPLPKKKSTICMLFAAFENHRVPLACYLQHFRTTTFDLHPICSISTPYCATYIRPSCCPYGNILYLHASFLPRIPIHKYTYTQAIAYLYTIHRLQMIDVLPMPYPHIEPI